MSERQPLDRANLNYPGNLTGHIEGQIVGPNVFGERFVILRADYDPATDKTTARLAHATVDDLRAAGVPVVTR